jgi:hypothetical protein
MARRRHRGVSREVQDLLIKAENLGCAIEHGAKHVQVKVPGGGIVTMPKTPSDHRSIPNAKSQLRRAGLKL